MSHLHQCWSLSLFFFFDKGLFFYIVYNLTKLFYYMWSMQDKCLTKNIKKQKEFNTRNYERWRVCLVNIFPKKSLSFLYINKQFSSLFSRKKFKTLFCFLLYQSIPSSFFLSKFVAKHSNPFLFMHVKPYNQCDG